MSLVGLLVYPADDERAQHWFEFDHAQEHATLTLPMHAPSQFGLANYLLDPAVGFTVPTGTWSSSHQQAHDDASQFYNSKPSLPLVDQQQGNNWWTFVNHQEHVALLSKLIALG